MNLEILKLNHWNAKRKDKVSFSLLMQPIADCFGLKQNGIIIVIIIIIL